MFFYRGQTVLLGIRRRKSMNRTFPPSTTISVSNQSDRKTHYTRTQFMYAYTRKQIGTHTQTCTHPDHASNFFLEEFYPIVFFHVIVYWLKPYFMHNGKVKRADDWIPHHSIPVMRIFFLFYQPSGAWRNLYLDELFSYVGKKKPSISFLQTLILIGKPFRRVL